MILDLSILVALVIGLTEMMKRTGVFPERFVPLVALVFGVGLNFLAKFIGMEYGDLLVGGIIAGLSACGLYSATKKVIKG